MNSGAVVSELFVAATAAMIVTRDLEAHRASFAISAFAIIIGSFVLFALALAMRRGVR